MALNLRNIAKAKNNIKRSLLNDYVELRFIGVDKTATAASKVRQYLLTVTDKFYYESRRTLQGLNDHYLYFVSESDEEYTAALNCAQVELVDPDGNFLRFDFFPESKRRPEAPFKEWEFKIKPNYADRKTII